MARRGDRVAALLGIGFVVLLAVVFVLGGSMPDSGASAAKVASWYTSHRHTMVVSAYLMSVVLVLGFFFYGHLRDRLAEHSRGLAATAFGGAVLFAVGGAVSSGVQLALAKGVTSLDAKTAQGLSALNDYVTAIAVSAGAAVLMFAASLAIVRGRVLPAWTGWLGFLCGVLVLVPVAAIGPLPAGVWTLVVAVALLTRRARPADSARPIPAAVSSGVH